MSLSIKYITAVTSDEKYTLLLDTWIRNKEKFNLDYAVWNLGKRPSSWMLDVRDLAVEYPINFTECNRIKPRIIECSLRKFASNIVVWLDVDTLVTNQYHQDDLLYCHLYDVAIPYRGSGDKGCRNRHLNAGVLAARSCKPSIIFLDHWNQSLPGGDQYEFDPDDAAHASGDNRYLERLVFNYFKKGSHLRNKTKCLIHGRNAVWIKFLDMNIWDCRPRWKDPLPSSAKVLHFAGGTRKFSSMGEYAKIHNLI
jgi:hypothetical protein